LKIKDLSEYGQEEVLILMNRIPFFKELQTQPSSQLDQLLGQSCIVELDSGETIMRRGDKGSWLYFLMKGRLSVYLDDVDQNEPLNHITPGELFGDLALLCDHERKATVAADKNGKKAILFATDFKDFGDLLNFDRVSLGTKLIFYRTMVHSIRWRLEVKKMEDPASPLSAELRQVPVFKGIKDSVEELQSLQLQAQYLAKMLDNWNSAGGGIQDLLLTRAVIY
jgi:hypothetical protein